MMTFAEMVATGATLYPNEVTADFRAVCLEWFQDREVADDERFPIWFRRVLVRDYPLYLQLLRVEPGVSQYDWLVQRYEEAQTYDITEKSGTTSKTLEGSKTEGGTITDAGTSTLTHSKTIDHDETEHIDKSIITDEDITKTHTTTRSGSDIVTRDLSGSDSKTLTKSGNVVLDSDVSTTLDGETNTKDLSKENPMSTSYTGAGLPATLDWTNPSGQNENLETRDDTTTTTRDDTTTTSETDITTSTSSDGGTITTAYGKSDVVQIVDDIDKTDTYDTDVTKDVDISETGTQTGTKGNTKTLDTETATSGSESGTTSGTDEKLTQYLHTGRDVDISTLLKNATSFIKYSSAWDWIRGRLDTCFIGIYDD